MTITLPSEKTKPDLADPLASRKILLYGNPKVGKSTLASQLNPDETLFVATEPGLASIEAFQVSVRTWEQFIETIAQLAAGEHKFKLVIIDTVDALAQMCEEHVVAGLVVQEKLDPKKYHHASTFDYGKGWDAIASEFRMRVSQLCNIGLGVVFISHTKEGTVKKHGAEITTLGPDVGKKGMRKWLLGYVDFIFHATVVATEQGERRVLQTLPTEHVEAGGRIPQGVEIPPYINLSAESLKKALAAWFAPQQAEKPKAKPEPIAA